MCRCCDCSKSKGSISMLQAVPVKPYALIDARVLLGFELKIPHVTYRIYVIFLV